MADPTEVILDEAQRKLERQSERFSDLRARAGTLLGSAAIVTSLFGFRLGGHHSTVHLTLIIAALVSFGVVVCLTLAVNFPVSKQTKRRKRWTDGSRLEKWLDRIEAGRTPITDPRFVRVGYWWVQAAA